MEDTAIIDLFFARNESAIKEAEGKYGRRCHYVSYNILRRREDAEECVSDTFFKAWNTIPPTRPSMLSAFLVKITRNLSLDRLRKSSAAKRGGGAYEAAFDEIAEMVAGNFGEDEGVADNSATGGFEDDLVSGMVLSDTLNGFLDNLSAENRKIFVRRYFYFAEIKEIARDFGISESKVKMSLLRSREKLKDVLTTEGFAL